MVRRCYTTARIWGMQPSEFWLCSPEEFWLEYDQRARQYNANASNAGRVTEEDKQRAREVHTAKTKGVTL